MNATDPTGEFANLAIGLAVGVGAAILDAGIQKVTTGKVDVGQSLRAGAIAGVSTALGPVGGALLSAAASGLEAGLASRANGDSVARTVGKVAIAAAVGGTVSKLTGGLGKGATSRVAVAEMLGEVRSGTATASQQAIGNGIGQLVGAPSTKLGIDAVDGLADGIGNAAVAVPEAISNFMDEASRPENNPFNSDNYRPDLPDEDRR